MIRSALIVAALFLTGCATQSIDYPDEQGSDRVTLPDANVMLWAEQVLLGPEFGGRQGVCSRWVDSPRLSVFGATESEAGLVVEVVSHLNETLADTSIGKLSIMEPDREQADILVYFAPLEEFPDLARKHGFDYEYGNWGYFWTFWNLRHEIDRAVVLLASDMLQGETLRHFALEEITQSLGLSNDSPVFPDSIFYSNKGYGGRAGELSEQDRKLVTFFYNEVMPGAKSKELRQRLEKRWPD